MFKSPAQRAAFFSALQKKKNGLNNPSANSISSQQKPIKLQNIGQTLMPETPLSQGPVQNALNQVQSSAPNPPKFGKIKKLMKMPKV